MKIALRIIFAIVLTLFSVDAISAQFTDISKQDLQKVALLNNSCAAFARNSKRQSNCERTKQVLDLALVEAQKTTDDKLIFVSRLGKNEKSKTLNQRRINVIKNYLFKTKFGAIEADAVAFKESEKSRGLGVIEVYLKDNLIGEVSYGKNVVNACKSETN